MCFDTLTTSSPFYKLFFLILVLLVSDMALHEINNFFQLLDVADTSKQIQDGGGDHPVTYSIWNSSFNQSHSNIDGTC